MQTFTDIIVFIDSLLGGAVYFPFLILGVGLFFTLYLGFPQIRFFRHAWSVLWGKHSEEDDPGDTTHFQALSTALSGTVGTGNIGGVAFAIYLGGPAALFWMWATAFLGMTTKFVEVSISHKYRKIDSNGEVVGGPMNFMEDALNLKWLAIIFAAATVISSFGSGNMPQANSLASGLATSFDIPNWVSGLVLAVLLGGVIIGGIKRIALVAATLVPLMGILYAIAAILVVGSNFENVVPSFFTVFEQAFTGSAATGGFLGASFAYAFNRGVNRGLFSNEAGQGSAPIAHASAKTKEPVSEGMVSILEPFIDTLVLCTLTGMVILSSGVWNQKFENEFSRFNMEFVEGVYREDRLADVEALSAHLDLIPPDDDSVILFDGVIEVNKGEIKTSQITLIHNRSIAESIMIIGPEGPYNGNLRVEKGSIVDANIQVTGASLIHTVPLTIEAFRASFLGVFGEYIVSIGLVLFAFSTALAWSYYGDRAITYLFGVSWLLPYRAVYVISFFLATISDTEMIWTIAYVTVALMTIPNLIALMLMRKEVKSITDQYWKRFSSKT